MTHHSDNHTSVKYTYIHCTQHIFNVGESTANEGGTDIICIEDSLAGLYWHMEICSLYFSISPVHLQPLLLLLHLISCLWNCLLSCTCLGWCLCGGFVLLGECSNLFWELGLSEDGLAGCWSTEKPVESCQVEPCSSTEDLDGESVDDGGQCLAIWEGEVVILAAGGTGVMFPLLTTYLPSCLSSADCSSSSSLSTGMSPDEVGVAVVCAVTSEHKAHNVYCVHVHLQEKYIIVYLSDY